MQLGMIGLGRMGANIVRRVMRDGHTTVAFDTNPEAVRPLLTPRLADATDVIGDDSELLRAEDTWVLATAPRAFRLERFAAERGLSGAAAEEALRVEDEARRGFIRHHFHERIDDPAVYDLTVNVAAQGPTIAAACVVDVYRRRFPSR